MNRSGNCDPEVWLIQMVETVQPCGLIVPVRCVQVFGAIVEVTPGKPIVLSHPESPAAVALSAAAARVAQQVSIASYARKAIPLTPIN